MTTTLCNPQISVKLKFISKSKIMIYRLSFANFLVGNIQLFLNIGVYFIEIQISDDSMITKKISIVR